MVLCRVEQGQQFATGIQRHQVVAAAHVGGPNKDLGYGAPTGAGHHVIAGLGVGVDTNFFNQLNPFGFQELLGADAIGADRGGVHLDNLHVTNAFS